MFSLQRAKGFYYWCFVWASLFWIFIRRSKSADLLRNLVYIILVSRSSAPTQTLFGENAHQRLRKQPDLNNLATLTWTLLWKGPSRVQVTKAMYVSSLKALEGRQLIKAFQGLSTSKALEGHQLKEALQWLSTSTHMLLPKLEPLKGFSPIPLTKFRSKSYVV